jgi:transposase
MGRPIEITRLEHSATALREIAAKTQDGAVVRRLLAIALVLEGHSREEAARLNGMDRQVLRDWVHRYNADGVAGLRSRWGPGRPPALNQSQMEELRSLVLEGPDLARNGVVRWRCAELRTEIAARWSVTVSEGTVGKLLHRLRMTRLQPRPYLPRPPASRSRCGSRTKPASGRRDHWSISGHRWAHVRRCCATIVMTQSICSARSVSSALSARPSSCRLPIPRR